MYDIVFSKHLARAIKNDKAVFETQCNFSNDTWVVKLRKIKYDDETQKSNVIIQYKTTKKNHIIVTKNNTIPTQSKSKRTNFVTLANLLKRSKEN